MTTWTLSDAPEIVRAMQPKAKALEFHIALGGGVLNTGASEKDMDLYILGFNSSTMQPADGLLALLELEFGEGEPISDYPPDIRYRHKIKYNYKGRRIDVFVQ